MLVINKMISTNKSNNMPKISILFFLFLAFVSCKQEDTTTIDPVTGETIDLQNRINQLELDNSLKDSVINEALSFFNEIKENLETIGIRKDRIRAVSDNPELTSDDKEWILEDIRYINFLREDNARKVKRLQTELKVNSLQIKELEVMVESLMKDIQWKDEQIVLLQSELDNLDKEYSALFDAYQEQTTEVDRLTADLNQVFYAYGSQKELIENKVIEKKNGFIGFGKKAELKDNFNDEYFTEISASKTTSINIQGTDLHFITSHPRDSYELEENENKTVLKILDASEFWKISNYLVIVID